MHADSEVYLVLLGELFELSPQGRQSIVINSTVHNNVRQTIYIDMLDIAVLG